MSANPQRLAVLGAGGHAVVCADTALRSPGRWTAVSFYDDQLSPRANHYAGLPLVGDSSRLIADWEAGRIDAAFVGIGTNTTRLKLLTRLIDRGVPIATLVDPSAIVSPSATIAAGTLLVAGAIVNARSALGTGVIVNTGASVDHDNVIAEGVHVAPGARLCGDVSIGRATLIGVGASVPPGRRIAAYTTLGAGGVAVEHIITEGQTWVGCPARPLSPARSTTS